MKYAGIGSRETPAPILVDMRSLAQDLAAGGWTLRTGGADGADSAFETGHRSGGGADALEVYLPWNGYNGRSATDEHSTFVLDPTTLAMAETIAGRLHPAWHRCRQGARKLHARNVAIVHGRTLLDDVDAVVCWTRDGGPTRGTGMGIRLAPDRPKPQLNLISKPPTDIRRAL
ncbi:MAG: hypothetical protein OXQ28_05190, partial [Acidobacteriota bacterium]|nr:hypothetical protein [Acidobacteriota bacterium]